LQICDSKKEIKFKIKIKTMKQKTKTLRAAIYFFCALFLLNSCNSGGSNSETTATDSSVSATATPATTDTASSATQSASPKLTDPEIASVAVNADQIDIDYAAIAKKKSKNAKVLEFAATMSKDHQNVNDQAVALAKKLSVTPKDNPTTQSLLSGAKTTKEMLNSKSGAEFDKAYIDNEVAYHKAAIDLVENTLIPDATNAELKSLLQTALPIFKEHLAHAEMVQKSIE
jgi:putative membrane protein